MNQKLQNILDNLPASPGVYKMKNSDGEIIYIGKAKNLRSRVKSYFQKSAELGLKKEQMVSLIEDIEYMEVGSDLEAFMLETNFIKRHRPKYNVLMKDDKNFAYIRVNTAEDFPRISITRRKEKDRARYFGPKTASHKAKQMLDILRKALPFRHCNLDIAWKGEGNVEVTNKVIKYPCLYYHIRRCAAPCIGHINKEEYESIIDKVIRFLEGKPDELMQQLKSEMMDFAVKKRFEKAALARDKLKTIEEMFEKQRISEPDRKDTDVFHFVVDGLKAYANLFQIRDGRIIGQENFIFTAVHEGNELPLTDELTEAILRDYYQNATDIPVEILIPEKFETKEMLEEWLTHKKGKKVTIRYPHSGEKNGLLQLSLANARSFAHQQKTKWMKEEVIPKDSLEDLVKILGLPRSPKRIECYDISHFGGTGTVASMVVLVNGQPENSEYRRFRLRTIPHGKPDDYASMHEVLTRRLKYLTHREISLTKATKKDFEEIKKIIEQKEKGNIDPVNLKREDFVCFTKKGQLLGFVRKQERAREICELQSLWVADEFRKNRLGHEFMYRFIEKNKAVKKWFVYIKESLRQYYESFGFTEVKTTPDYLVKRIEEADKMNGDHGILLMLETKKLLANYKKFVVKPHLIILDGGKGQLNIGVQVLKKLNLDIPICALAKQEEEIFTPNQTDSIKLPKDSKTLHLMQQIRDESHRFAVSYSNLTHSKSLVASELDALPNIGDATKKKLLNHFGSLGRIRTATMDELARVAGKKAAMTLKQELSSGAEGGT